MHLPASFNLCICQHLSYLPASFNLSICQHLSILASAVCTSAIVVQESKFAVPWSKCAKINIMWGLSPERGTSSLGRVSAHIAMLCCRHACIHAFSRECGLTVNWTFYSHLRSLLTERLARHDCTRMGCQYLTRLSTRGNRRCRCFCTRHVRNSTTALAWRGEEPQGMALIGACISILGSISYIFAPLCRSGTFLVFFWAADFQPCCVSMPGVSWIIFDNT